MLRATRPWGGDPVASSRRARYSAGDVEGRELPAYADEAGVDPARGTETLAEMTVEIANWRWAGVPFRLRSGKALKDHRREIVVTFQPAPHVPTGLRGADEPDGSASSSPPTSCTWSST
ncbi:Glucose-6-phosphate 1-dehydrogenase [Clavibacter michiganensis subsp. michiganensis]|uniref:Glucose-6-phosphate 1-dehydrogenase n=1 Tax=Clavibacter michiganensis subsp. michiganensis TaxID=33013 RepID=A0A251XI12_CLAMM|nr:Glucose-6-phosphate 1-dehydrogenase [Clavibacter michiganensis subsp. michiganensis]OUE01682.1 Glucose-6-phosphate 1-dehydrogenase [Clavibacter michiganensis subsp. michiganensis]